MKLLDFITGLVAFCGFTLTANAQDFFNFSDPLFTPPKSYIIHFTDKVITIDGQPDEPAWEMAKWSEEFVDIEGEGKPRPLYRTRFKMLWDEENLYIYAKMQEPHIWAYYDKHDMIVYHENDFEVFIDPDGDTHNYYEFELNARNTLFDLFMDKPYRDGGRAHINWDAKGLNSAVICDGSLNNPEDEDLWWSVEMQIPFGSLTTDGAFIQPKDGSAWKINFSRVQWQTKIEDGKYVRKEDHKTGELLPENNWVWSPQGVINMHYPERWGIAVFTKDRNFKKPDQEVEENAKLSLYLWAVYYRQKSYAREHHQFASSLQQLNLPNKGKYEGIQFEITINASDSNYNAVLVTEDGRRFLVNHEGNFTKPTK